MARFVRGKSPCTARYPSEASGDDALCSTVLRERIGICIARSLRASVGHEPTVRKKQVGTVRAHYDGDQYDITARFGKEADLVR